MKTERHFVDVVEKVYALALSEEAWEPGLKAVSDLLGASCVSFEVINKRLQIPAFLRIAGDFDPEMGQPYLDHYSKVSPRVRSAPSYSSGDISCDYQFITEQEIDKDEYYNDFAMPQGHRYFVAGHLLNDSSHMALFAAQRSPKQGHVERAEIELATRLLPHFQQALNLKFRLAEVQPSLNSYLNSVSEAVFGITSSGRVAMMNETAEGLISRKDGIDCAKGKLLFADRSQQAKFDQALKSMVVLEGDNADIGTRDFVIESAGDRSPYLASMRPIVESNDFSFVRESQAVALLFVRDPEQFADLDVQAFRVSFNLSQQEIDLASSLDKGISVQEVAELRGVAITTVRSQLYSLMSKVGVSRQADLIRLLGQYRRPFI